MTTLADLFDGATRIRPHTNATWDWHVLDIGNAGITRAAFDEDGDLWIQNLHYKKGRQIPIFKEALPTLRELLDMAPTAATGTASPEIQTLLQVCRTLMASFPVSPNPTLGWNIHAEDMDALRKAVAAFDEDEPT